MAHREYNPFAVGSAFCGGNSFRNHLAKKCYWQPKIVMRHSRCAIVMRHSFSFSVTSISMATLLWIGFMRTKVTYIYWQSKEIWHHWTLNIYWRAKEMRYHWNKKYILTTKWNTKSLGRWKQETEERIFFLKGTTLRALMTGIVNGAREKNVTCPTKSTEHHTPHTQRERAHENPFVLRTDMVHRKGTTDVRKSKYVKLHKLRQ